MAASRLPSVLSGNLNVGSCFMSRVQALDSGYPPWPMCILTSHVVLSLLLMTDGDLAVLQHYYFMYAPLCSIDMYGNDVVILF